MRRPFARREEGHQKIFRNFLCDPGVVVSLYALDDYTIRLDANYRFVYESDDILFFPKPHLSKKMSRSSNILPGFISGKPELRMLCLRSRALVKQLIDYF